MRPLRTLAALCAVVALGACEVYESSSPDEIARAVYSSDEPPSITLISMVNAENGRSAHSALLINGSQRVLYDPAGTFQHPELPRRGDIHYGITPRYLDYYERYHARFSHYTHNQKIYVSRATADQVMANAEALGRTPKMLCAGSVTGAIRGVEPFTQVRTSLFPEMVRRDFASIAGVEDSYVREFDIGQNKAWETTTTFPAATPPPG
jgi:hypothetical protein